MDKKTEETIIKSYQSSKDSIQDIARIYNVPVSLVLNITGNGDLSTVQTSGDLISEQDAGPGAQMNYGKAFAVPFTVD